MHYGATDSINQRFTGKERDAETGLDFFGARYMSSAQGRFTSVDPGSAHPVNPQSWNRYAYVNNNPLSLVDPDGKQAIDSNLWKQLQLLRAPKSVGGPVRGGLIQLAQRPIELALGKMFGFNPNATKGDLSPDEYRQLQRVSSYKESAFIAGVGDGKSVAIDGIDITNGVGISLKTAATVNALGRNAEEALDQVTSAGFYNIELYVTAGNLSESEASGLTKVQRTLGESLTKVVVFTKDGPVTYEPTKEQLQKIKEKRDEMRRQTPGTF